MRRSKFSLSHYKLLTCDMGKLVPISLMEVLPGDTLQQATSMLLRVSPLLAPVMHPVHARIHHWFVPHRLVWEDWEPFITGGPDGMDASVFPTINIGLGTTGTLADYLGCPAGQDELTLDVSALPFRAYAMIWNEFYRDQDLQSELVVDLGSGPDTTTNTVLQNCNWEKDYFTSARPWTQKGPAVTLPFGQFAPVVPNVAPDNRPHFNVSELTNTPLQSPGGGSPAVNFDSAVSTAGEATWNTSGLRADLSSATAVSINALREAFAIQRYEEARARYGSRYTEYLRYLGVRPSDARLQRPEYLGGGRQTVQFSEVLQTAPTADDSSFVGEMRGHGIGALRSNRYRRFFEEHGYIISLLSVQPKTMYAQGLSRTWNRRTKEDFWQQELQHIGQQEVLNKEVYAWGNVGTLDETWGYQDRYDEYRRMESGIAGEFRDQLDFWHYARVFSDLPALNSAFVTSDPTKRVNAVQSEHVLWIMARHSVQARRMVAGLGTSFIK